MISWQILPFELFVYTPPSEVVIKSPIEYKYNLSLLGNLKFPPTYINTDRYIKLVIKNTGKNNILGLYSIPQNNYEVWVTKQDLIPGEETTILIKFSPKYLGENNNRELYLNTVDGRFCLGTTNTSIKFPEPKYPLKWSYLTTHKMIGNGSEWKSSEWNNLVSEGNICGFTILTSYKYPAWYTDRFGIDKCTLSSEFKNFVLKKTVIDLPVVVPPTYIGWPVPPNEPGKLGYTPGQPTDLCTLTSIVSNLVLKDLPITNINEYCTISSNLHSWVIKLLPKSINEDYCTLDSKLNNLLLKNLIAFNNNDYCTLECTLNNFILEDV